MVVRAHTGFTLWKRLWKPLSYAMVEPWHKGSGCKTDRLQTN